MRSKALTDQQLQAIFDRGYHTHHNGFSCGRVFQDELGGAQCAGKAFIYEGEICLAQLCNHPCEFLTNTQKLDSVVQSALNWANIIDAVRRVE